jgi:hypothetical protein
LGLWPDATPFGVDDGGATPAFDEIVRGPSAALTAVALVAGAHARASGWAAHAAVAVAARWPAPRAVVLADLDLDRPSLHELTDVDGAEGAAELVEFGMSLTAVRRRPARHGFDVVPAGTWAPDPGATLRSDAWDRVLLEIAAQRHTLLAYVPADADGMRAVVERAGAVIVLAEGDEADAVCDALPHPYSVMAVLVPAAEPVVPAAAADEVLDAAEPEPEPVVPAAAADEVLEAAEPADEDEPLVLAAAADEVLEAAEPAEREREREDEPLVLAAAADEVLEAMAPADVVPEPEEEPVVPAAAAEAVLEAAEPVEGEPEPVVPAAAADEVLEAAAPAADEPPPPEERARRLTDAEFESIRLPTDRPTRDTLIADLRRRQRQARMAPPPAGSAAARPMGDDAAAAAGTATQSPVLLVPAAESEHAREMRVETAGDDLGLETLEPDRGTRTRQRSRYRTPLIWTVTVVLLASALAGAWRYLGGRLGWDFGPGERPAPAATAPGVPSAPVPEPRPYVEPREVALPYAVAMEAHIDAETAAGRVEVLQAGERLLMFHVVPLEREGVLRYHVMSGPVPDSATALALRDTLLARRLKRAETPTDIRYAPLAFLIGDYGTRDVAEQSIRELRRLDIPAYFLLAEAADGYPLYRVYVGGYATTFEADAMQQLLRAVGVTDSLVTRTGIFVP